MIVYRHDLEGVTADHLVGPFFEGWPDPPDASTHLRVLEGSACVVLAWDDATDAVVGFVNALSDGGFMAFIPLLEVVPDYRGRGIGGELVRRVLRDLAGHYAVDAMCDPGVQAFYARLGMQPSVGVSLRDYDHQSGR